MRFSSINPYNEELIATFEEHTPGQIDEKLDKAAKQFSIWRRSSFDERYQKMSALAKLLREKSRECAELMTREMGKPIKEAAAEVDKCAWVCEHYAHHAESYLTDRVIETDAKSSYTRCDPLGPILAVMPWNFPFWQVFRFAAPTLMAGNVGILKHASNVPQCALEIEQLFYEAGFPDGAFSTLLISGARASEVIADKRVAAVTVTGSEAAGRAVAQAAGKALKKSVLELGGSDPFIVLSDADLEAAARTGAKARLINSGQSCIAAKRFIVEKGVLRRFEELFRAELESARMGDPLDEATAVGPLARGDLREELHGQVQRTLHEGAELIMGGQIPKGPGFFYPVTLLRGVGPKMTAASEETFGPVAPLIAAEDADDAIRIANGTPLGLGASLWTRDIDRAQKLAADIDSGSVFINGLVKSDPRLPFGGIKDSGYGRELSQEGIREFVNLKTIWVGE